MRKLILGFFMGMLALSSVSVALAHSYYGIKIDDVRPIFANVYETRKECTTTKGKDGTVPGAIVGGAIGSQSGDALPGAIIGGIIGSLITPQEKTVCKNVEVKVGEKTIGYHIKLIINGITYWTTIKL